MHHAFDVFEVGAGGGVNGAGFFDALEGVDDGGVVFAEHATDFGVAEGGVDAGEVHGDLARIGDGAAAGVAADFVEGDAEELGHVLEDDVGGEVGFGGLEEGAEHFYFKSW